LHIGKSFLLLKPEMSSLKLLFSSGKIILLLLLEMSSLKLLFCL
jgi:hypothetical protein